MANRPIWPGSSSFTTGSTPFGFYDTDPTFRSDADKVARYCAIKLGYPIMDVELQDIQFYACFEEAISVYAEELYHAKIKDNYLSLEGSPTASTLNNQVVVPTLNSLINLSETYGNVAGIGGTTEWYTGSITMIPNQQTYDMQQWAINNISMSASDRIVIQRVFYEALPAASGYGYGSYYPQLGGASAGGDWGGFGAGTQAGIGSGFNSFIMFPVYWDLQRIQELEMANQVRRSAYSFELINNKLTIFPRPEADTGYKVIWFNYSIQSEMSNIVKNSPYSGSTNLISNPSNVPYTNITYNQINQPGKQWIFEYSLALASELLGLIRGKYAQIPAPGAEVTLNSADLISKGKDQQQSLREKLRQDFEDMSRQAQMQRKQTENQTLSETLNQVPLLIYVL